MNEPNRPIISTKQKCYMCHRGIVGLDIADTFENIRFICSECIHEPKIFLRWKRFKKLFESWMDPEESEED